MPSREQILATIQKNLPQAVELPDHEGNWIQYPDPLAQFQTVLESVGGELYCVNSTDEIPELLGDWISAEKTVVSCVPDLLMDRFNLVSISDPHLLENVDVAILPGELVVAENAAIWVTDEHVPLRVLFFLTQHLTLVVPRSAIVNNMHEAYERITPQSRSFGTFISGPSKTADIEQALVKGAHGARTLKVFLVEGL